MPFDCAFRSWEEWTLRCSEAAKGIIGEKIVTVLRPPSIGRLAVLGARGLSTVITE